MAVAPLQIPGYAQPTAIDWSPLAKLGESIQKQRKQSALGDLMANADFSNPQSLQALATQAYGIDPSTGLTLANLGIKAADTQYQRGRDDKNDAWRREESARAQRNADRSYGLQVQAAKRADADKFQIVKVDNPDGSTSYARVNTRGPEGPLSVGGTSTSSPANPFSSGGKLTDAQGKASGFADRMLQSEGILSGVGGEGGVQDQGLSLVQSGLDSIPVAGNYLKSTNRQKYEQAKRDFINAQLRRESGAVIGPTEFESADKQYFPVPGDSPDVVRQKAANRRAAVEAMGREGGASYRPKFAFDQQGRIIPYGGERSAAPQSAPQTTAPRRAAQPPSVGTVQDGYRFKGGNPADPNSWEPFT